MGSGEPALPPAGTIGRAALLAPLTGARTSIGQIMQQAASVGDASGASSEIFVIDSGDTPESAVAAARSAVAGGAVMIAGPLFSAQARPVADAVGRNIPVVALTNDSAVAGGNLFVFGVTPLQSAKSVMGFAASRGLRRIGIVVPPGRFGELSIVASRAVAAGFGFTLVPPLTSSSASGLVDELRRAGGGTLPDAVYLPIVGGAFESQAAALSGAGIQVLGSDQWSAIDAPRISALEGAWYAAPDPVRFEAFAIALEQQSDADVGVVAGLTFDVVEMARVLGRLGRQNREGLLREAGFDGVVGPYRFLPSGQCERGLAILKISTGITNMIGNTAV
jgi:ABC-type branched-subunit amino acid transport system substrate-binding protein